MADVFQDNKMEGQMRESEKPTHEQPEVPTLWLDFLFNEMDK